MQKRPLQDIVPKPSVPRRVTRAESDAVDFTPKSETPVTQTNKKVPPTPFKPYKKRRFPLLPLAGAVVFVVVLVGILLSIMFSGATVTVHPRHQEAFVNGNFIATQDDVPGQLPFKTVTAEKVASKEVPATKSEQVEERASGKITIYNNFDATPQRLIKNTRFESKDGKIFRINESITVPGKKVGTDGTAVPGSVEAVVFADAPGDTYNIPASEFKIPGFEGTDRYNGFYATSKEPMTGGFKGTRNSIDDTALASIRAELENQVKTDLSAQTNTPEQVTEGYYSFKGASFFELESLPIENVGDNVKLQVKGTLHTALFDKAQFAAHLASAAIAGYDNTDIVLENPDDLKVTITPIDQDLESEMPWQNKSLRVEIHGTGKFVWQYNEEQLKKDLSGKEKDALNSILSGYPSIEKAEVAIRPFWKKTFPQEVGKIKIIKKLD